MYDVVVVVCFGYVKKVEVFSVFGFVKGRCFLGFFVLFLGSLRAS